MSGRGSKPALRALPDYDPHAAPEESIRTAYEATARNVYELHAIRERLNSMAHTIEANREALKRNHAAVESNLATVHPVLCDIETALIAGHKQACANARAIKSLGERVESVVKRVSISQGVLVVAGYTIHQLISRIPW